MKKYIALLLILTSTLNVHTKPNKLTFQEYLYLARYAVNRIITLRREHIARNAAIEDVLRDPVKREAVLAQLGEIKEENDKLLKMCEEYNERYQNKEN